MTTVNNSYASPVAMTDVVMFKVVNNSSGNYVINNGKPNPTLTLTAGETYTFDVLASGHPFWIKTRAVTGTGSAYNNGVTNNGTEKGRLTFTVPFDAPSTLYYICQYHTSMQGIINIQKAMPMPTPTPTPMPMPTPTPIIQPLAIAYSFVDGKFQMRDENGNVIDVPIKLSLNLDFNISL